MKTILKKVLILSFLMALLPINILDVKAVGDIVCDNGQYELDRAKADGSFEKLGCYTDFASAKVKMTDKDMVIRQKDSLSRMKIVAMKQGVAYTYFRNGDLTTYIYQYSDKSGKSTYVSGYYEMIYLESGNNTSGQGMVYVNLNGFKGYTDLSSLDLIPQVFIDNGVIVNTGSDTDMIASRAYYSVRQNGNYRDLIFTYFRSYTSSGSTSPQTYTVALGPAPDELKDGLKYYSDNGYDLYSDVSFSNKVTTYYNYYDYLPLRSITNINSNTLDNYISKKIGSTTSVMKDTGQLFLDAQNKYGVNALMVFALGCLESGYGTSSIATTKNNLFGWNAVDTSPGSSATTFSSITQSINEQMALNLASYLDAFNWRYFGSHIGNKGSGFNVKYASDPYWGLKISGIAYDIDKSSKNGDGSLSDFDKYDLYVAPIFKSMIYRETSFATKLYSLDYGGLMQEANVQIAKEVKSNYIKVQSSNVLSGGEPIVTKNHVGEYFNYNFDESIGYMKTNELTSINNTSKTLTPVDNTFVSGVDSLVISGGVLNITGYAYKSSIYSSSKDELKHYLVFTNGSETKEVQLTQVASKINNHVAAGYSGTNIDVSFIKSSTPYTLSIKTVGSFTETTNIINEDKSTSSLNGYVYTLSSDSTKSTLQKVKVDIEKYYNVSVSNYSLSSSGDLSIKGIGLVEGLNNSKSTVVHKLNFINLEDGSIYKSVDLSSITGDYNLNDAYNDPYDYSYGWYEGKVNIKSFDLGDYSLQLETVIGSESYKRSLSIRYNQDDIANQVINGKNISLVKQYYYSYRIELKVQSYYLKADKSAKLPSIKESYIYISNLAYNSSKNNLNIAGSAVIWKTDMSTSKPNYTVYLINQETGKMYTQTIDGKSSLDSNSWDQSAALGGNYSNSWFDVNFDTSKMEKGTYIGLVRIKSGNYIDYVDLKTNANITMITDTNLTSLRNSNNKNLIEITIK